jgi:hypothetical protein
MTVATASTALTAASAVTGWCGSIGGQRLFDRPLSVDAIFFIQLCFTDLEILALFLGFRNFGFGNRSLIRKLAVKALFADDFSELLA